MMGRLEIAEQRAPPQSTGGGDAAGSTQLELVLSPLPQPAASRARRQSDPSALTGTSVSGFKRHSGGTIAGSDAIQV